MIEPAPAPLDPPAALPRPRRTLPPWGDGLAILMLALVCVLPGLGGSPLARTEPHRAVPAHDMVTSGEWLTPRLYGVPYLRKPPLHYWLLAATEMLVGSTSEWVYRLPSALSSVVIALVSWLAARRWFGRQAGLCAGAAAVALVAMWGQFRSADVDAPNAAAAALASLAILEIGRRNGRRSILVVCWAGLGIGAVLLIKLHAAMAPVAAAMIAALWIARGSRWRVAGCIVLAFLLGTLLFLAWAIPAFLGLRQSGEFDFSGLAEAADRAGTYGSLASRATIPLAMVALGLPATLAIVPALLPSTRRALGEEGGRLVVAIACAWALALLIGAIGGVDNARYAYVTLPLLAPRAGAVAAAAAAGAYSPRMAMRLRQAMTLVALAFGGASIALVVLAAGLASSIPAHGPGLFGWTAIALAASLTVGSVTLWIRRNSVWATVATFATLIPLAWAFTEHRNAVRGTIASTAAAEVLARSIGPEEPIISGLWVFTGPELFWYADRRPRYLLEGLGPETPAEAGTWLVFHADEWARLTAADRSRFDTIVELPVRNRNAIAARRDR